MDSIRMYLDLIYEYEPTSVPFKEHVADLLEPYIALDKELAPDAGNIIDLELTEIYQARDFWYTRNAKEYRAALLILKKDWIIDFIEVTCNYMIIYLAHLTESETKIRLCLLNK
ncbi:hypothetical protein [Dyadobacter sediminis]|uniref:Uncharacterized protein n=1 Tax=Dyadobacter sediminis TaxID=1493691 RepID=A0A5R9KCD6_9BACT|nr:hypothetical protein [Dyadobacter sediminis]TLU92399.1 hypothetical protein FEM55_16895 [Dyadobacter sediminis]GGB94760.1 hypothetical protein GCM10011325_22680 [Dyadobacter sediminis]